MSAYPPPGAPPPGAPPPGPPPPGPPYPGPGGPHGPQWQQPVPPPGWRPQPGMLGAAHKPGAIPLRPLTLGEMYDGAFRIIRFNPKATVGSAVLVASVTMLVPVVVTAILTWTVGTAFDLTSDDPARTGDVAGQLGAFGSLLLGAVLQVFGLLFVTAMVVHVTAAAAIGRRLSLGEAWAATRGSRWRLVGLALLLWLMAVLLLAVIVVGVVVIAVTTEPLVAVLLGIGWGFLGICVLLWFWIRVYYLPVPALMLERIGVFAALGRGFTLTRRQFWRTFGIALLTYIIAQIGGSMLSFPLSLIGQLSLLAVDPEYALLGLVLLQALTSVIAAAFVAPFSAAVSSLQYIDQRMRKEAFDVELMTQAGLTAS